MFISHIGAMDSFARGLKIAAKIKEEGVMAKHVKVELAEFIEVYKIEKWPDFIECLLHYSNIFIPDC